MNAPAPEPDLIDDASSLANSLPGELVEPATLASLIRLAELAGPARAVPHTTTLEQVHRLLTRSEDSYVAVLDGRRPVGLSSRARIGILMGARFGFALYSHLPVTEALLPEPLVYCADDPVETLLQYALSRSGEAFHEDVILVDGDGGYLGLVPTWKLAQLQNQLLAAQIRQGREQQAALRRTNLEMFHKVAELHQSEARYRTLFNNSDTGFALLDPDGTASSANARLRQILGASATAPLRLFEVLPPACRELFRSPAPPRAGARIERATEIALTEPARGERRLRLQRAWIPETGQWCVAIDDVTEERALQARALEREKRSLLEALVGGVAHELNNKLAPVVGFASMLAGGVAAEEAAEYGRLIGSSAAEAARIIGQLLNLSKPVQLQCDTFQLRQLVTETLALLRFRLRDAGVQAVPPAAGDDVEIYADPGQIRQVLLNLCVNAIDAMAGLPRRVLSIAIGAEEESVRLVVSDTGTGIAPENLGRLFQPFFTTKGPNSGTGLGLSICASIIERHGGAITVCNRLGGGAEFTVRLPRAIPAGPPPAAVAKALPLAGRPGFGGRVLVVEDEEVVARLVQEIVVRHFDCEVVRAADGREALSLCAEEDFAVIVSDLRMPMLNGLDFHEQLVQRRPEMGRRFVFMSGYAGDLLHRERLARSGVPVLPKPFTPADLVSRLRPFALLG
ncbi:MAG TPA: ATP-binding protein [Opitutaceae bacterium]|nr:ATP-binding protein [Opitutaceae bacterium]